MRLDKTIIMCAVGAGILSMAAILESSLAIINYAEESVAKVSYADINRVGKPERIVFKDNLYTIYTEDTPNGETLEYTKVERPEGMAVGVFEDEDTHANLIFLYGDTYAYHATFNGEKSELTLELLYDGEAERSKIEGYKFLERISTSFEKEENFW